MSLWKRFKEELGRTYDQVNTLDGGKSYNTRTSSGPVGVDKIRDTFFDANTKWDYEKRNRADSQMQGFRPNMTYKQQQEELFGRSNVANNFGQSIVNPIARSVNTFGTNAIKLAAVPTIAASLTKESITGTDSSYQNELDNSYKFMNEWGLGKNNGLLHAGTHIQKTEELNDPKKFIGSMVQTAADIGSFIPAGKAANAGYTGVKGLIKTIANQGTENAIYNVASNAGEQLNYTGKIDPKQVAVAAATGYVAPVPFYGAGKVTKKVVSNVSNKADNVGGIKNLVDPTKDNEFMQYRTNYDTYAKAWDKETNPVLRKQIETGLKQESENMNRRVAELKQNSGTSLGSGPMAGYDAVNNAKAKNASDELAAITKVFPDAKELEVTGTPSTTVKVAQPEPSPTITVNPGTVKKGQTQSITDLMPDIEARRAAAQNIDPIDEIAKANGIKRETVEKLHRLYGPEKTKSILDRNRDVVLNTPGRANDKNGFIMSAAKQEFGTPVKVASTEAPTVKVMSPEEEASLYSTQPTPPVQKPTVKIQGGNQTIVNNVNEPNFVFRQIDDDIYTMRANGATDKEIIQQLKSEGNKDGDIAEALLRTSTDEQPTVKVEEPTQEPTIKVVDGQKIDTTTGEILDTPRQPAKNLDDFVKNLPDSKTVTREEADALIVEGTDWLRRGAQAIDDALRRDGDSYENFSRAIHQANIDGVEPPAKYVDLYNKFVKPALDKYREASGRVVGENIGDVNRYYLPRMRVTDAGQVVFDDTTLINSIDNKVFGSGMSRRTDEFQLGVDDIDHTPEGLSRYATQALSERYRDAKAIGKVIDQAKARGVELDVPQARTVVDMENELSQKISDAARKGGVFASGTEKLDLVDEIGSIGTAKGKEKFVLDKGLSWANRQISDSNELYSTPYGGSGKSIGEVMGFERYTRAEAGAVLLDDTVTKNGLDVAEHLDDYYKDIDIDPDAKAKIIDNTKKRINYINDKLASMTDKDGNPVFTEEQLLSRRQHAYMNAEKNIARQQLVEFLENTEIQSKQLKKNINQDARRMLVMDASNRSIADKTVGAIVGIKYVGLLGYSVRSALFNILESRRVFSKFGTKDFLYGVTQAFKDPEMARRMGVHETRVSDVLDVQNKNINPKYWKPMGLFQKSEQWKDNVLLHAAQNHYKKKGLGDAELLDAVLDDFNKYGIKYGQAGTLGFNKSKTGRLAGQFLQFAIKDWKIRISEGIKAMGGKGATEAEKKAAQAYLARDIPSTLAVYLTMSAALGISWQEVAGLINPMQSSPIDKDAPTDVKAVNAIPGGPFIQDMKDLYIATRMAFEDAEEGESPELGNVYKNQLIKDASTYVPGGQQIFNRTGEFINDQIRGYDENSKGRARYEAADDPINIAKGLIFGSYTTDNAREYYGRTGVAGDLPGMGGEQKRPVSEQYQKQINEGANPSEIIDKSRTKQERDAKFYNTPQGKAWKELYTTTYNPDTKKEESDVISPEKWKGVQADKSSTTYTQLKEAAQQRNKDFGDAVDPLFTDKWARYKNEIMTMRSQYTGDDKEMKDIANATKPWYKEYMKDYIAYINQIKDKEYEESDLYGVSPRVKEYWDLTTKNPAIPENTDRDFPIISKYYDIKNSQGEEKAKEFFKANADALSAAFDAQTKAKFEWTNQMRALEGADAIDWDTFQNITFGFEADEASVYKQLGYKLGKYGSGGGTKSGNAQEASFGRMRAAPQPTIKVKVSKVKATPKAVKPIAIKRTGKRI